MDAMTAKGIWLAKGRFSKKILSFYVIVMMLVAMSPIVCLSDPPTNSVIINGNDVINQNTFYTDETYANISVNVSDDTDVSSFIDWDNSLVGYWNFEYINGNSIVDNSSHHNNASCVYGRNATNNRTNDRYDQKYGQGFYFNGSGQGYLNVSCSDNLNINGNLTLELWLKEFETTFNETFSHPTSNKDNYGMAVEQTSDGGYIIALEYNSTSTSDGDLLLIKTDSNGLILDNSTPYDFNNPLGEDTPRDVKQTRNGGYIVVGSTNESGGFKNLFVKEYDSDLNAIEGRELVEGGPYADEGHSIEQTQNGDYIITGYYMTKPGLTPYANVWVLRINNTNFTSGSGNKIDINNTYGDSSKNEQGRSIKETRDGKYIVLGYDQIIAGGSDYNISVRMLYPTDDDITSIIWENNTYGWSKEDKGYEIQETSPDNGYIIIGHVNRTTGVGAELYLLKINDTGKKEWDRKFNVTNTNKPWNKGSSVIQSRDGGYVITGETGNTEYTDDEIVLIKTDPDGEKEWNRTYNGHGCEVGWKVRQTTDGGYLVIGNYNNSVDIDAWLLKTDAYGNLTNSNNNQGLTKTLVGKGRNAYQLELYNGTISGHINGEEVTNNTLSYNLSQQWNHVVLTYDHNYIRLYVNKQLVDNESYSGDIPTNANNLTIGKNFSGIIDEVRIWNRTLSWGEINASYDANATGSYYRNFTGLSPGNHRYNVYCINESGGINETGQKNVFVINNAPILSAESPGNNSTGSALNPTLSIRVNHSSGYQMNITWYWGTNSSCPNLIGSNTSVNNGTYRKSNDNNFSSNGQIYYWKVIVNDGNGEWTNATYHFTTVSQAQPPSGGPNKENNEEQIETNNGTITPENIYPIITIIRPLDGEIVYDLTPTIKATYTTSKGTIETNNITLKIDSDDYTTNASITSTTITYTPQTMTFGTHSITLTVKNSFGNTKQETWPFIINPSEYTEEQEIENATTQNTTEIIPIDTTGTIIETIKFKPNKNLTNVKITIVDIGNQTPQDVTNITGYIIYKYLNLKLTTNESYIEEGATGNVTIVFKVNKSWTENENRTIDNATIIMMRYNTTLGKWENLTTKQLKEDKTDLYFEATSPGLSTFAVVGSKIIEKEESKPQPGMPWMIIIIFIISAITILIIILFKARYIYMEKEEK